jgi:hypothetical protein
MSLYFQPMDPLVGRLRRPALDRYALELYQVKTNQQWVRGDHCEPPR